MLTNCLAACAHLTITVSEIDRDIYKKNRHFIIPSLFLSYPLAFDALVRGGGSRRNIGTPFGVQKLEWCRYPMMGQNVEDTFVRFDVIHERDGRTDTA